MHIIQNKMMVSGSSSFWIFLFRPDPTLMRGPTLRPPVRSQKIFVGQNHIYLKSLKRCAFNGIIFNWNFRLQIFLILFLKHVNIVLFRSTLGVLARQKWKLLIFIILVFGAIRSPNNMEMVLFLKDFTHRFYFYPF